MAQDDHLTEAANMALLERLRDSFRITPVHWRRITDIVLLHLALDSLLFALLAANMLKAPKPGEGMGAVDRLTEYLSKMSFETRLNLAKAAGWLPVDGQLIAQLNAVNKVRVKLVHYQNKELSLHAPEIASAKQFNGLMKRGLLAHDALVKILMPRWPLDPRPTR
jgi:hypothetical protein